MARETSTDSPRGTGWAGRVAERPVVPEKPGNAGGGKGPYGGGRMERTQGTTTDKGLAGSEEVRESQTMLHAEGSMTPSESRMRENRTSGLTSGGEETWLGERPRHWQGAKAASNSYSLDLRPARLPPTLPTRRSKHAIRPPGLRCACLPCSTYCSSTPARAKRLEPRPGGPLKHFASPRGEKCRLVPE